eukprot:5023953-Pyramimonas_sp.AAC.1
MLTPFCTRAGLSKGAHSKVPWISARFWSKAELVGALAIIISSTRNITAPTSLSPSLMTKT